VRPVRGRTWSAVVVVGLLLTTVLSMTGTAAAQSAAGSQDPVPALLKGGLHRVESGVYNLGASAFHADGFLAEDGNAAPIELTGDVHYPADLRRDHPAPLVILLHGRHSTCSPAPGSGVTGALYAWPCPVGYQSIPSYRGYDYLASDLASFGYVVVSIGANGINARDAASPDIGMSARSQLVTRSLDLWKGWSGGVTKGPFGKTFTGAIDFTRIGTMGHSRGGEGVIRQVLDNAQLEHPYQIGAVLALAPVDFGKETVVGVPFGVVLPYCDGDVRDLQGVGFYDDSRYAQEGDLAPKSVVTISGANHNFFNTQWSPSSGLAGTRDDGADYTDGCAPTASGRLNESRQRDVATAYLTSFFRLYIGGEKRFAPLWQGATATSPALAPAQVQVSHQAGARDRLDINRFTSAGSLTTNSTAGAVIVGEGLTQTFCDRRTSADGTCLAQPVPGNLEYYYTEPDARMGMVKLDWSQSHGTLTENIAAGRRDFLRYSELRLRMAVDYTSADNATGLSQDLSVSVVDGAGRRATVSAQHYRADPLGLPPGFSGTSLSEWRFLPNDVVIPLNAFHGVNLADVRSITLGLDRTAAGVMGLSGLTATRSTVS
jgi:hypothetical protein